MRSVVATDKNFVTLRRVCIPLLIVLVTILVLFGAWMLATLRADGWPMIHSDAVLFLPAASSIANGEGFNFSVYTRLFLAREPSSWALDLHGQIYPWLLAQLARSGHYQRLISATGTIAAATVLLGFFATALRLRVQHWSTVAAVPAAAAVAVSAGVFSFAYAGRPEQLVPMVCFLFVALRAHPAMRNSAVGYGLEVGTIAACSPAPALLAGLLYVNWMLLSSRPSQLLPRLSKLALASVLAWVALMLMVSPYAPWEILLNTVRESVAANVGSPIGRRFALEMLVLRLDLPWIGLPWLLLLVVVVLRAVRQPMPLAQRAAFWAIACITLAVFYRVGLERYTSQYTFAGLGVLALMLTLSALDFASQSARGRWFWGVALVVAAAPSGFGLLYFAQREGDHAAYGDSRAVVMAQVAALLESAQRDDRMLVKDGDAPLFLLEQRPKRILSVIDLTPAAMDEVQGTLLIQARWILVPSNWEPQPPPGFRFLTSFSRNPARRDWQAAGYGVHVFEKIE